MPDAPFSSSRRTFLHRLGLGAAALALPACRTQGLAPGSSPKSMLVYIGTYTDGASEGIYRYRLDLATGALAHEATTAAGPNPSFLAIHPDRRALFAVNEVMEHEGEPGGAVSAFAVDGRTGDLALLGRQPTRGGAPCYVTVDRTGGSVLVANYMGGNVTVLPVAADGRLGAPVLTLQHEGSGPNAQRQEAPHAHCILLDEANRHAYAVDLGLDRVMIYRFDAEARTLGPNEPSEAGLKPGAGPRHLAFHPGGRYAYVINELDSTVTAFDYDRGSGGLRELQTLTTLPEGFTGHNQCADLHVGPSGRFLYGSNRGHDSLVIYAIDAASGRLTLLGHEPTQGDWPRNFAIDPTGQYLLAANQRSDTVVTFRLDADTGRLHPTGHVTRVPSPVCLLLTEPFGA